MEKVRGFEIAKGFENEKINMLDMMWKQLKIV